MRADFEIHQWPQVPVFAKEVDWPAPNVTADRILALPRRRQAVLLRKWKSLCHRYQEIPPGQGRRAEIVRRFNQEVHADSKVAAEVEENLQRLPSRLFWAMQHEWEGIATSQKIHEFWGRLDDALSHGKELGRYALPADASYDQIRAAARRMTRAAASALHHDEVLRLGNICKPYRWKTFCIRRGLRHNVHADTLRALDEGYWSRRFRRLMRQTTEKMWLAAFPQRLLWCSADAAQRALIDEQRQAEWAATQEIVADDGTVIDGSTRLTRSQKDKRRYAELIARFDGLCTLAARSGRELPFLITITLPPEFHPTTTWNGRHARRGRRRRNKKHDGSDPYKAHCWAQKRWGRARAAFMKADLMPYWILAVQPHKDESPHYHVVTWFRDEAEAAEVEVILRRRFGATASIAIDMRPIDGEADAAVGYAARTIMYIGRAVAAEFGSDGDEALRASEWSRVWGMRRFRTSVSHATVWRMLRRKDVRTSGKASRAQRAARNGDFARFVLAVERAGLAPAYEEAKTRYGEESRRLIGVQARVPGDGDVVVFRPSKTWEVRRQVDTSVRTTSSDSTRRASTVRGKNQGGGEAAALHRVEEWLNGLELPSGGGMGPAILDPPSGMGPKPPSGNGRPCDSGASAWPLAA